MGDSKNEVMPFDHDQTAEKTIEIVKDFIDYVELSITNLKRDEVGIEIEKQYSELCQLLSETIICSEWYEKNVGLYQGGITILVIQYLKKIRAYEVVLMDAKKTEDNKMINFYYAKINDLKTGLREQLCKK